MTKKKHQGEPAEVDSSEGDENENTTECSHIRIAIDLAKVKKSLIRCGLMTDCETCQKTPNETEMGLDLEFDTSLWLCLRCGHQACGRNKRSHALQHNETPHSDSHALCVNTTLWQVWCYDCDAFVNINCKKKLLETVEYLQKLSEGKRKDDQIVFPAPVIALPSPFLSLSPSLNSRPRGLSNLGNTCFFNSVVQCLAQTPYLLDLLNETSEPGQYFELPGGCLNSQDPDSLVVEPMTGYLEKWRPLTCTLAETIGEVMNGRSEAYNPRMLLAKLTGRMPQFGGGDQHDSHELLRHLLEAVREEDLKRYQTVILDKLGFNKKTDPSSVDDETRKKIKFYGQQASELLLPTEQVFRGVLVSNLQCEECKHTSRRDEFFLDLSLPITEKQLPPVLRRKAEEIDDNKPSKHQMKKEKKAERKKNKKQKSQRTVFIGPMETPGDDVNMENLESESDADVEDNTEEGSKGIESGYNSDKVDNSSPDSNNRGVSPTEMRIDDSGVPSPAIGMSASHGTLDNSPASSEANIDMSPITGHCSPEDEDFDRPQSRLEFAMNKGVDLKMDLSKLSLLNDGDSNKVTSLDDRMEDDNFEGACGGFMSNDEKMEEGEEDDTWTNTMSARYQCEEGEYSVQSCLNQFTASELMMFNNQVTCELCTKRHGGLDKKPVYTDATKQLVIYNPPAVLILHLKRFQVFRFRSAKVNKFVKFPTVLDLAPCCPQRSRTLPTVDVGQTKVLYSLYGIVEHSGSMHGGHYVAYVKVRSKPEQNNYRWQFLPKNQQRERGYFLKGTQGEPEVPPGKWYYISDSHVQETSESRALSAQAYLLFYERIL